MDFGLKPSSSSKTSILLALNQYLIERASSGRTTALLIDDAQKLTTEVLQEIEMLSNLETRKQKLLQVIMAARPEFETQLERPEHAGLRQRIVLRPRLGPLNSSETADYIRVRLDRVGKIGLASALPVAEIYRLSNGIPRLISTICGQLLELRGADDQISSSALKEVAETIGLVN
jgi:general secretion pathway protein A